jgi:hypothetical protein
MNDTYQAFLKQQRLIEKLEANKEKQEAPQASASRAIYPHLRAGMTQAPLGHRVVETAHKVTWRR